MICPICEGNPVDPKELEDFIREMNERTIPAIVKAMQDRARAANELRSKGIPLSQPAAKEEK